MKQSKIIHCPGTLAAGYSSYSRTALKRVFNGKKVKHTLPYPAPFSNEKADKLFDDNRKRISISGVQEKFSVVLEKNLLRLRNEGEQGQYILKPVPRFGQNPEQMPANEHLTMQIARQVFGIETAENAMIFFSDGSPAYITKRFDVKANGDKWAQEDFASLAGLIPQTHGENYKYLGNYLDLFELMKKYLPAYKVEAPKLIRLILFNYLMSNGDAHHKNFSIIETTLGDYKLSPAYDLLNTKLHIKDKDFALEQGLLPPELAKGKAKQQFEILGHLSGIPQKQIEKILLDLTSNVEKVQSLIQRSYLSERFKRRFEQNYLTRLKKLSKR